MKRIKESAKITLTLGQLKRLVKEGFDGSTDREYAVKNLRDYACNKIIGGEAEEIMNPDSDGSMRRPLTDTREVERYARDAGLSKVCVLGDELDFRHNSIEYTLYKKDGEYAVLCTELERRRGYGIHLYVVKLDGELADDARMLDDSDLQYESRKRRVNENIDFAIDFLKNGICGYVREAFDDGDNLEEFVENTVYLFRDEINYYNYDLAEYFKIDDCLHRPWVEMRELVMERIKQLIIEYIGNNFQYDFKNPKKRRVNEGPGAGYSISIANAEVNDSNFEITESGDLKGTVVFSHNSVAEGYDWGTWDYEKKEWTSTLEFTIPRKKALSDMMIAEVGSGNDSSDDEIVQAYSNVEFDDNYKKSISSIVCSGGWVHSDMQKDVEVKLGAELENNVDWDNQCFTIYEIGNGSSVRDSKISGVIHFDPGFVNLVNDTYRTKDEYDEEVPESVAVKETAEVSGFKRDSFGCEFMGRFGSMRKPQSWVIYPKGSAPDGKVYIQCKNRWGEIDVDSGILWMSAAHGFANNMSLTIDKVKGKAERIELDRDTVDQIVDAMDVRDGKRATGPERDTLLVVGDDEPKGKGPWSDPDYADYIR